MEEIDKMIESINNKIQKIIDQKEISRKGMSVLIEENKHLTEENEVLKAEVEKGEAERRLNLQKKDARSLQSTGNKINELIKEIDMCIKLMDN